LFDANRKKAECGSLDFEPSKSLLAYQTINKFNSHWEKIYPWKRFEIHFLKKSFLIEYKNKVNVTLSIFLFVRDFKPCSIQYFRHYFKWSVSPLFLLPWLTS